MLSWEEAEPNFPDYTTVEAFDEFLQSDTSNKTSASRFVEPTTLLDMVFGNVS